MLEINKIYNEDCLEGMKKIDDESIDCIICDLPYGTTKNSWDSVIPLDSLWTEYKRIIKPSGAIVLFAQTPFDKILGASNIEMLKYEWIWEKDSGTGHLNSNFAPLKKHENILVFSKKAACFVKNSDDAMVYHPQMGTGKPYVCKQGGIGTNYDYKNNKETITVNNGNRYPTSILKYNRDKSKIHPTQKPVELIEFLVKSYCPEGGLVLDNCMGSGTTAVACINTNRKFIGFEIEEKYFKIANVRIIELLNNETLF